MAAHRRPVDGGAHRDYVGLLYQDLIKWREVTAGERLPPVLPAVICNGAKRWTSARELAELIEACAGGLSRYQLRYRYFVLDEGDEEAVEADNTFGTIVALETGPTPDIRARMAAAGALPIIRTGDRPSCAAVEWRV